MGNKNKQKRKSNDGSNSQPDAKILRLKEATEELVKILGVSSFGSNGSTQTPAQWIKTALNAKGEAKKESIIEDNLRFYLGGGRIEQHIENAVDKVFERDYQNEGPQIFVPPQFIPSSELMRLFENDTKDQLTQWMDSLSLSEKKEAMSQLRDKEEGELAEQEVYVALKKYFEQRTYQEVLVIHSYHFSKKMPEAADREKDFIIVNKTFGYIMNIEVKSSPSKNAVNSVREQLIHTKNLLTD